jgi:hypothetical protein
MPRYPITMNPVRYVEHRTPKRTHVLTETKHYCDRCGEIILAGRTNYRAKCGPDRFRRPD